MKTIRYQEIDGHKVIVGFDQLRMDPVATMRKVDAEIVKTAEYKEQQEVIESFRNIKPPDRDPRTGKHIPKDWYRWRSEVQAANEKLRVCAEKLGAKREEFILAFKVFFCPRENEIVGYELSSTNSLKQNENDLRMKNAILESPEKISALETAQKALPAGKKLRIDGKPLDDYRGQRMFVPGNDDVSEVTVAKLGDKPPAGAVRESDLDELHARILARKRRRAGIASLAPDDRAKQKQAEIDGAAARAAQLRSIEEIKGNPPAKALEASQAQYQADLDAIEDMYNV
jgi:hypothetical protein